MIKVEYFTPYGGKVRGISDFVTYFQSQESKSKGHWWGSKNF